MKKSTCILLVILALGLIAAGVLVDRWHENRYISSNEYGTLGTWPAEEITAVRAELSSLSVSVYEHTGHKELEINGYGRALHDVDVRVEDATLILSERRSQNGWSIEADRDERLIVYLPRRFAGGLTLSTDSGEVSLSSIGTSELSASVTTDSGEVNVYECEFDRLQVRTDSGDIWGNSILARQTALSSESGEIRLGNEGIDAEELTITTDSGQVSVTGGNSGLVTVNSDSGEVWTNETSAGTMNVHTDSGDGYLGGGECTALHVETGSGDVDLSAVRTGSVTVRTGSGNIYGSVEGVQGEPVIETSSDSGDVNLETSEP